MDNYFLGEEVTVNWAMKRLKYPFVTMGFHRTLSTYFNAIVENGFFVEAMREPFYDGVIGETDLRHTARIAYFLIMKCRKIG